MRTRSEPRISARKSLKNFIRDLTTTLEPAIEPMLLKRGDKLFIAGEKPDGAYFVYSGSIRLFFSTSDGTILTERKVRRGEILGLGPLFSNKPFEATAEALSPVQAGFLRRDDLLNFLDEHPEGRIPLLQLLSQDVVRCYDLIKSIGQLTGK